MGKDGKYQVRSVETTFQVLDTLVALESAGVTELADYLNQSKSSVHNYLSSLESEGYVVKEGEKYSIGARILKYGQSARARHDLFHVAKPELDELARETGELTNLAIEENGRGVYLYRGIGKDAVNVQVRIGTTAHLHCTGLGKAILAHLPRSRVDDIIEEHGLPAKTQDTITERSELLQELDAVQERGIAFDFGERLEGLRCVAAPIRNSDERVLGAVSLSAPARRTRDEDFSDETSRRVKDIANLIELNIP